MSARNTVKSIQDIMRKDAGVDGDAQRLSQLCWMFFLKIVDDQDQQMSIMVDGYRSPIPTRLQWRTWAANPEGITGAELMTFVNGDLFPSLKELPTTGKWANRARVVRAVFEDAYNYMKDGQLVRQVVNKINDVNFNAALTWNGNTWTAIGWPACRRSPRPSPIGCAAIFGLQGGGEATLLYGHRSISSLLHAGRNKNSDAERIFHRLRDCRGLTHQRKHGPYDRHDDGRDQRVAQVLQEQVHHQEHQQHCLEQRLDHLVDRDAHVRGGIEGDEIPEAARKLRAQLGDARLDALRLDFNNVATAQAIRVLPIFPGNSPIFGP